MSKLYTADGWVNWRYLWQQGAAFTMVVGARGVGKTYGLFKMLTEGGIKFIYLRRLKTQLDACADAEGNPFKKLNSDTGDTIAPIKSKSAVRFYRTEDNNGRAVAVGECLGYGLALSTVATIRGMDFSDVDAIVFDEAVPMAGEKPVKNEFESFLNFYETVNRNRELEGREPVRAFLLGNANRLANPYFSGWGFMRIAIRMIEGRQMVYRTPDNTRMMVLLLESPISQKKSGTALYTNANESYKEMALSNAFRTDPTSIRSYKLRECLPIVSVGEIGIYRHKGTGRHYVSKTSDKTRLYAGYGIELKMFRRDYVLLKDLYLSKLIDFEDYESELVFREYFDLI